MVVINLQDFDWLSRRQIEMLLDEERGILYSNLFYQLSNIYY